MPRVAAIVTLMFLACADPTCPPGQSKRADTCYPVDPDASAPPDAEGDGSSDAESPQDARPDSRVDAAPCGGKCTGDTTVCSPTGACVQCAAGQTDACTGDTPFCDTTNGVCVGCRDINDCKDPKASVCDSTTRACKPCAEGPSGQCDHITGKNVCAAGECVQCTKDSLTACMQGGTQFVCNSETRSCDFSRKARSKSVCNTCVDDKDEQCKATAAECLSDLECQPGQRCVQTKYEDTVVGWFCHWERNVPEGAASCGLNSRPFAGDRNYPTREAPATTVTVCGLRASSCPAYRAFSTPCGRYTSGQISIVVDSFNDTDIPLADRGKPAATAKIAPDDTLCGLGGACVATYAAAGEYLCTIGCSTTEDCDQGSRCPEAPPQRCSVN